MVFSSHIIFYSFKSVNYGIDFLLHPIMQHTSTKCSAISFFIFFIITKISDAATAQNLNDITLQDTRELKRSADQNPYISVDESASQNTPKPSNGKDVEQKVDIILPPSPAGNFAEKIANDKGQGTILNIVESLGDGSVIKRLPASDSFENSNQGHPISPGRYVPTRKRRDARGVRSKSKVTLVKHDTKVENKSAAVKPLKPVYGNYTKDVSADDYNAEEELGPEFAESSRSDSDGNIAKARLAVARPDHEKTVSKPANLGGIFWGDVWNSSKIRWVGKTINNERLRPSERQFFHQLLPEAIRHLNSTCVSFSERDERDFTVLKNISWKDPEPSLVYPTIPKQCAFGRSSGFLCMVVDDGRSCYYASGWGQDRAQVMVDGRQSNCDERRAVQMLSHSLGLMHEYDRGDVLRHVHLHPRLRVLAEHGDLLDYRIPQDNCDIFRQNKTDLPFDFESVVLFDDAFRPDSQQMDYDLPLVPRSFLDVRKVMAYRKPGLSHFDKLKLSQLYPCKYKYCLQKSQCHNYGFRNRRCECECAPKFSGMHCQNKEKPKTDYCTQKIAKPTSLHLNETACPIMNQTFNYTINLSTKQDHRFVIRISMSSVFHLLHGLRILPDCRHARVYFSGSGAAWPQKICADTLLKAPLTLRTRNSTAILMVVANLPTAPVRREVNERPLPTPRQAIGGIHLEFDIEMNPSSALTVETILPAPSTSPPMSPTPEHQETEWHITEAPSSGGGEPQPPAPEPEPVPEKEPAPSTLKGKNKLEGEAPLASRSIGGKSKKAETAIIVVVVLLLVGSAAALGVYVWLHRGTAAEVVETEAVEGENAEAEGEVDDDIEYATSGTQAKND